MGTLRNLVINNVRCESLIYFCYSVYKLLELLSESLLSEGREEKVVLGKRVSQPPVIGRWLIPPRARTASRVFLTRKHIVSQICRVAASGAYLSGSTAWRGVKTLATLSLGTSPSSLARLPDHRPTSAQRSPSSLRSLAIVGKFSKRRNSKFADLGARHVAHHYQDSSYAFGDTANSFWASFGFGCEERVTIRGVVFFQEKTCNCDIGRGAEEAVNPRATMEANHGAAGAIFI